MRLDEEWQVLGNMLGQRYELRLLNWGKLAKTVGFDSSQDPSVSRDKDALFLPVQGGHLSPEGLVIGFRGEARGQGVLPAWLFLKFLLLKISKIPYFGAFPNSLHPFLLPFWGSIEVYADN